jgi:hypothetical protein
MHLAMEADGIVSEPKDELEQDELDDDLESDDEENTSDSGSDNSAPPANEGLADGDKKRVDDLMSKWQAEQAKAKKLEKELAAERAKAAKAPRKSASDRNSEADEFIKFTRESARKQLFDGDPRFAKYGLGLEAIAGDTLDEMKESAKSHLKLIEAIESKTRNDVLSEHGLEPEVETGVSDDGAKSFEQMSDQEFQEFLKGRDARPR